VDETFDSVALLQRAVDEALLRRTSLRVLTTWQTRFSDLHDSRAVAEGNRCTQAHLDRLLERWRRCYPDLDLQPVTVHGNIVDYLAQHGSSVQLVVVGSRPGADPGDDLFGPAGYAALHDIDCSILVCERRQSL
jgi:hypothetical protein